jgi:hypothetical protein
VSNFGSFSNLAHIGVQGPAGTVQGMGLQSINDQSPTPVTSATAITANTPAYGPGVEDLLPTTHTGFVRFSGTMLVNTGNSTAVTINYSIIEDTAATGGPACTVYGSAYPNS